MQFLIHFILGQINDSLKQTFVLDVSIKNKHVKVQTRFRGRFDKTSVQGDQKFLEKVAKTVAKPKYLHQNSI